MSERTYGDMFEGENTTLPSIIRKRIKDAFDAVLPMAENSLKIESATDTEPFYNTSVPEIASHFSPSSIATALIPLGIEINERNAKSTTDEFLKAFKFYIGKLGNYVEQMNNYQVDLDPRTYEDLPFEEKYAGIALQMCFVAEELSKNKSLNDILFDEYEKIDSITAIEINKALFDQKSSIPKPPAATGEPTTTLPNATNSQISHLLSHIEELKLEVKKSGEKPVYVPEEGKDLRISTLFEEYRIAKIKIKGKKGWNEPTGRTEQGHIFEKNTLVSCIGNLDINLITREDCHKYQVELQAWPKQFKTDRHGTVENYISENPEYETISLGHAKTRNQRLIQFLTWCKDHQLNYLKGDVLLKPLVDDEERDDDDLRDPFSSEQLKAIFSQSTWTELKFTNDYHYWVPLMALYTGARGTEICQLHREHIIPDPEGSGYAILIEKNESLGTRVKSDSDRTLPLHPDLIELNFIDFLNKTKTKELFPKLWKTSEGKRYCNSRSMQQRFNQTLLTNLNIKSHKLSFHSFRHSFGDIAMKKDVLPEFVDMLRGHRRKVGHQSPTGKKYGSKHKLDIIREPYLKNFKLQHILGSVKIKPWSGKIKNGMK